MIVHLVVTLAHQSKHIDLPVLHMYAFNKMIFFTVSFSVTGSLSSESEEQLVGLRFTVAIVGTLHSHPSSAFKSHRHTCFIHICF